MKSALKPSKSLLTSIQSKLQNSPSPDKWYCEALYQAKVNFLPLAQLMPNFLPLARNGYDQTLENILS